MNKINLTNDTCFRSSYIVPFFAAKIPYVRKSNKQRQGESLYIDKWIISDIFEMHLILWFDLWTSKSKVINDQCDTTSILFLNAELFQIFLLSKFQL